MTTTMMTTAVEGLEAMDNLTDWLEANVTASNCSAGGGWNCTEEDYYALVFERVKTVVVPAVFGIVFLLGLLGNSLVILVVTFDRNMRNTTNILILSLAVADLLFIVLCVPFTATMYAIPYWPFGNVWCKTVQYLIYVSAYLSVYTLVLMSLDRYLAVVHAIRSINIRTERNTWLAIAVTWVVIMVINSPLLLLFGVLSYNHGGEMRAVCTNLYLLEDTINVFSLVSAALFFAFGYLIPLGATCVLYGLMLRRLHNSQPVGSGHKSQESMKAKRRVTKMVVVIVLVFAACWLPLQLMLLIQATKIFTGSYLTMGFFLFFNCLAYTNSCVNPFLYAFLSENFRRSFGKFLCCGRQQAATRPEYELMSVKQTENVTNATALKTNHTT